MNNRWYVLTGGPGSGKTSLMEELNTRGHAIVKESARYHVRQQLAKGLTLEQIRRDEKAFQEAVFRQKQIIHEALSKDVVTFFDRGYHDTLAYLEHYGYAIKKFITEACRDMRYEKVFVLDMLPYRRDEARIEDFATASQIHEALITAYQKSGHDVVHVPVLPLPARADFILSRLG